MPSTPRKLESSCKIPGKHEHFVQEAARSASAGVRSVPYFLIGGRVGIAGGQSEDEIAAVNEALRNHA